MLYVSKRERNRLKRLLRVEMVGGILVMIAAVIGFALANSPASEWYFSLRDTRIGPEALHLNLTLGQWASDGLLAVFFFLVGLELKREFVEGALSRFSTAIVPVVAAAGGVITPALIYLAVNAGRESVHGWAIPTATDIAFAVAVLGLIAPRVPLALRIFLLTLAVVDDFIAIGIIAFFYTNGIQFLPLIAAIVLVGLYALLTRRFAGWYHSRAWAAWLTLLPIGIVVWTLMHASGVHATIAGVLLAFTVPVAMMPRGVDEHDPSDPSTRPHHLAEHFGYRFGPISTGIAVPVFAFFAAGVAIKGSSGFMTDPVTIGIVLGLVLGKPIGIVLTTLALTKWTGAELDPGVKLRELIGVGALAGVGFTVAMLVAELSFDDVATADTARLAVMTGSVIAVVVAALFLVRPRRG
ncbi:MAG: Na+/H+ antiporter NhaA [Actinobacteria bacterium]|nr:Na+/H+ antiporter NhaA [Actinomycetota bacterium]